MVSLKVNTIKKKVWVGVCAWLLIPVAVRAQQPNIRVKAPETPTHWGQYGPSSSFDPEIIVTEPHNTPEWALLQRELLRSASVACEHYFNRYVDEQGESGTVFRW